MTTSLESSRSSGSRERTPYSSSKPEVQPLSAPPKGKPPPFQMPPMPPRKPDVEHAIKAMQNNPDNDQVGVFVEIPERSMREMLPVIVTFFCILTCLVPVDVFLALHIMNNHRSPIEHRLSTRIIFITDTLPPITRQINKDDYDYEYPRMKRAKDLDEVRGARETKSASVVLSTENWCDLAVEVVQSGVQTIIADLKGMRVFSDKVLEYAVVYSIKLMVMVPLAALKSGPQMSAFVLPQLNPAEIYVFDLTGFESNAQTLRFMKLDYFDASNFSNELLNHPSLTQLGRFDIQDHNEGPTAYKSYQVNFVIDPGLQRIGVQTCGRSDHCTLQRDSLISVAALNPDVFLTIYAISGANTTNIFYRPRLHEQVCCQVYSLDSTRLRRTKLCRTKFGQAIPCNDTAIEPACGLNVQ